MKKEFPPGLTSSTDPSASDERVIVGHLGRPHGLRGHLLLVSESDNPKRFVPGARLYLEGGLRVTVRDVRHTAHGLVIAFDEAADRTEAERFRGASLFVAAEDRRQLGEDEYWPEELVGLEVRDPTGRVRGQVIAVDDSSAQARLMVSAADGERVIPMVRELIPEISVAEGYLVVIDLPGLLADG